MLLEWVVYDLSMEDLVVRAQNFTEAELHKAAKKDLTIATACLIIARQGNDEVKTKAYEKRVWELFDLVKKLGVVSQNQTHTSTLVKVDLLA